MSLAVRLDAEEEREDVLKRGCGVGKSIEVGVGIWRESRRIESSGYSKMCSMERGKSRPQWGQGRGMR